MTKKKQQRNADGDSRQIERIVIQLLREFFENRTKLRKIKIERIEYRNTNNCINFIVEEGDCIDRQAEEYCGVCKKRDELHKEILRLSYRNNGILTSLRAKVV